MEPHISKLSAWLALFVVSGYVVCPTFAELPSTMRADVPAMAGNLPIASNCATVTHIKPDVKKLEMGKKDRAECKEGDQISEGTVIFTGKSPAMAELKFGQAITRLWSNSAVRIYPASKTVCLGNGAFIFNKDHRVHDEYIVETKRLQARIRGTTVRLQIGLGLDEIQVWDCTAPVEIWNKVNNTRVNLTTGVVLQVKGTANIDDKRFDFVDFIQPTSALPTPTHISHLPNTKLNPDKGELIFWQENGSKQMTAFTANSKAALEDPLACGDKDFPPVASINFIREAMAKVPSSDNFVGNMIEAAVNRGKPDKIIAKNLTIVSCPKFDYRVGPNVGLDRPIHLPRNANPELIQGVIPNIEALTSNFPANLHPVAAVPRPVIGVPITPVDAPDPLSQDTESNN